MKWYTVREKLPPKNVYVLVARYHENRKGIGHAFRCIAIRMDGSYHWLDENEEEINSKDGVITHWMFIPDLPEDSEKCIENQESVKLAIQQGIKSALEEALKNIDLDDAIKSGVSEAFAREMPKEKDMKDIYFDAVRKAHLG